MSSQYLTIYLAIISISLDLTKFSEHFLKSAMSLLENIKKCETDLTDPLKIEN